MYTLFSGLNVATVGAIAFAAVQPATIAITDPLFRVIVVFSACAGLCYNTLWYFPDKYCCVSGEKRILKAEVMELTGAILPLDGRVRQIGGGDLVSRTSFLSLKSTTGSVQLR